MWKTVVLAGILAGSSAHAQQAKPLVIDLSKKMAPVSSTMWGVFFEDINLGADGGIYAELIKNRSFEFYKPLMGWKTLGSQRKEGSFLVLNRGPLAEMNPRFLRIQVTNTSTGGLGLENEGFRGMGLKQSLNYDYSCLYRLKGKGVNMRVELLNEADQVIGETSIAIKPAGNWQRIDAVLRSNAQVLKGKCRIWLEGDGQLDLDMVSLFPTDTWKGRKGGLRADMVQLLADLKPGFVRFPGGCIVEGHELSTRYQWKKTVGPVENRQTIVNRWNTEFSNRSTPDYFQSFGLGFFEYFQLAEDIGAAALPILNCGMACQFNTAEVVPMDQLDAYIQDALDLVEFANGDVTTQWGKLRADMGHPEPFHLQYIGVGNENWGPQYIERLKAFTQAIKAKYPAIKIISSAGTDPEGDRFDYLNRELRAMPADFIDEHYYRKPDWFFRNAARYDSFDRNGPKIFAGEYASHPERTASALVRNNWLAALSEAAFMTGLERNGDIVQMASYAPLFAHIDGWQWTPDLIWLNNLTSYGSPSYYVQKLFSTNKGTHLTTALRNGKPLTGEDSLYVSSVWDENSRELIIKMVNAGKDTATIPIHILGKKTGKRKLTSYTLQADSLETANSIEAPQLVVPKQQDLSFSAKTLRAEIPPHTFIVWRIPMK